MTSLAPRLLAMFALAFLAFLPGRALGQGTEGIFPEPLDWRSFQELVEPLDLSQEQVSVLETPHQEYLVSAMALRDGPIADFMENVSVKFAKQATGEELDEQVAEYRKISRRMAALENEFLDGLAPALSEEQVQRMSIVKDWRERQRILESPWPWPQWAPSTKQLAVELRPLVEWDILDEAARASAEQALASNEERRTSLARQLFDHRLKGHLKEREIEAELGPVFFPYDAEGNKEVTPEAVQAWEDEQLRRHHEAYDSALKAASRIRAAYHEGVASLVSVLPDREGRDFRWAAWRLGYGLQDTFQVRRMVTRWIERVERNDENPVPFEELLSGHDSRITPHARELMELADADAEHRGGSFFYFKEEAKDSPMARAQSKLQDEQVQTAREFHALLGDDAPEDLRKVLAHYDGGELDGTEPGDRFGQSGKQGSFSIVVTGDESDPEDLDEDGEGGEFMFFGSTEAGGPGSGLDFLASAPAAMSSEEIELLTEDLGMGEENLEIVDVLFETYQKESSSILLDFQQKRKNHAMAMAPSKGDDPAKDMSKFVSMNRDMQTLQQEAVENMSSLDEQFFDDLVLAVEDSDDQVVLEWHRLARQRTYAEAPTDPMMIGMAMMAGPSNNGWKVDLMRELGRIELPHEHRRAALVAMGDWHRNTTDAMYGMADLQREESEHMTSLISTKSDPADIDVEVAMESMNRFKDITRRRTALQDEQMERNETALEAACDVLAPETAAQLRLAWNEASYPAIYIDPHAVGDKLLAAMELEGLDESVRADLLTLQQGYGREYAMRCDELVELFEGMPPAPGMGSFDFKAMEEREKTMNQAERIRFERDDLSDKTRDRLRAMLTEEQVRQIGGLKVQQGTLMHWPKR